MGIDDKAIKLIVKLNRETGEGKLSWASVDPPRYLESGTDHVIPLCFKTTYKGRELAIFERRLPHYNYEDDVHWSSQNAIAVLDDAGRVVWEYADNSPALADLMVTVQESAANVDSLLDDLLAEDV